jgi:hypothetical protein
MKRHCSTAAEAGAATHMIAITADEMNFNAVVPSANIATQPAG